MASYTPAGEVSTRRRAGWILVAALALTTASVAGHQTRRSPQSG